MVLLTVSRSSRELESFFPAGDGVDPGTYGEHRWGGDEPITSTGAALDLQRRPPLTHWKTKSVTPGPGAYNLRRAASETSVDLPKKTNPPGTGTISFRSHLERISKDNYKEPLLVPGSSEYLPSSVVDNPGPGQYNLAKEFGKAQQPEPVPEVSGKPAILAATPPSFPPLRKTEDARYTGRDENTLAPGDYEYGAHQAMSTKLGHSAAAANFHNSTSQRRLLPKPCAIENVYGFQSNPAAPGLYELRTKLTRGTSQPFASKSPQLGTSQPLQSTSCSTALTPGPGSYPQQAEGDKKPLDQHFKQSAEPVEGEQEGDPPLASAGYRSTVMREGLFRPALLQPYTDSDNLLVPGPGHYPKPASAFRGSKAQRARSVTAGLRRRFLAVHTPQQQRSLQDTDALVLCGFASTTSRDCLVPDRTDPVAEPGTYDRAESLGQSIRADLREPARIAKNGAFGSTRDSDRFFGFPLNPPADGGPAPGDHGPEATAASCLQTSVDASGGAFRSKGQRSPPELSSRAPGPGHYKSEAYTDMCSSTRASPSVSAGAFRRPKRDHLSFGSSLSQGRFDAERGGASSPPGPGEYNPDRPARPWKRAGGAARSSADRQLGPQRTAAQAAKAGLGPGLYDVGGTMEDLSRRTFNRTAESAAAELQRAATG